MTTPTTEQQQAENRRIDNAIAAIRAKVLRKQRRKARRRKLWGWFTAIWGAA